MLMVNKDSIEEVKPEDLSAQIYVSPPTDQSWRIEMAKEIIEIKNRKLHVPTFTQAELDTILEDVMT